MVPVGATSVAASGGLRMAKGSAPETPPPGAAVTTVTDAVAAAAMSAAVMAAVSCVLLTKVVTRALPFHCTTELGTKPAPVTVSVKALPPVTAPLGASAPSAGAGLLMVNVTAPAVPPPGAGENTVTEAVPALAMSVAVMAVVSCVALTKVVARALPFHCTTEAATKPVPVTVSVKALPPAVAPLGPSAPSVGAGLLMVNVSALEAPPPGAGETTVTDAVPAVARSAVVMAAGGRGAGPDEGGR